MKIKMGLDIGNGYVKGKAKSDYSDDSILIDLPSTVSYTTASVLPAVVESNYIKDIFNNLDCSIQSNTIAERDKGRVLVGKRAILSGESQVEFNIENHIPKCKESLSGMLILSSVASTAIYSEYKETKKLPDEIDVEVDLAIALPINDYMEYKNIYKDELKKNSHYVTVFNFEKPITVKISFDKIIVLAEGCAGQFAITFLGATFLDLALDMAREDGLMIDENYTGEILSRAENTIGVDIGEGTVNFPVFINGKVAIESSSSINKGYGSVLTNVVSELRNTPYAFESRKDLADFMLKENLMPAQQKIKAQVQVYIDRQVNIFVRDVMKEFSNIFRKVGLRTDIVYVYGGGANAIKDYLYPSLIDACRLDENNSLPVIYLDSSYSRDLNRNGLFDIINR